MERLESETQTADGLPAPARAVGFALAVAIGTSELGSEPGSEPGSEHHQVRLATTIHWLQCRTSSALMRYQQAVTCCKQVVLRC